MNVFFCAMYMHVGASDKLAELAFAFYRRSVWFVDHHLLFVA